MTSTSRRSFLLSGAAAAALPSRWVWGAPTPQRLPDFSVAGPDGVLQIIAVSARAFRVRFVPPQAGLAVPQSSILLDPPQHRASVRRKRGGITVLDLPHLSCEVGPDGERLRFFDRAGRLLLSESAGGRRLTPSQLDGERVYVAEQAFEAPADERLYGTGCFQDGALDLRTRPRRLTQVNTQISLPFLLSSRGYGLLWHNPGMSELNTPSRAIALTKADAADQAEVSDVTTSTGNAKVTRREATFEGELSVDTAGRYAFLLDIGRKMASRHHVEIDGRTLVDFANLWLPPTTSGFVELEPGTHRIKVVANDADAPVLHVGPALDLTAWRSPVADAVDYVVIAGPTADEVMGGYRELLGATPMPPRWALGYIHCRERFHSSDEIISTLQEFRRRQLPVDVVVQDWQYWGRYGWNAMRFDERYYPDPAALVRRLHELKARFMLSVWSKVGRETDLGRQVAAAGYYIPDTEWVDFFNPAAAAFYAERQNTLLGRFGIDAWWQDATEPENDDLVGRITAAGPGERVRLTYPLQVARTVYEGRRQAAPDQRVMILTRSAFLGQHRYAAATWSGDIGNGWDTLSRQIPAGLNMAAAGYPYWTVDAGGFFRPGEGQYADPAYHERFLRWFQYATFLPLQRVHGYQTDTEFWRYGPTVETIARKYLELRYRLLPYTYSLAAGAVRRGGPIMRPLVFDFPDDPAALEETHSYMFGRALHVAPVLAAGAQEWPVYLPRSPGGWFDLWTGEHREGGRRHDVPAPLDRLPVHVRAGALLPLGPVLQSTADATGNRLDLLVFPGRDGRFELYDDDGLDYGYERGASSLVPLDWHDGRSELRIGARRGAFPAMPATIDITAHRIAAGVSPMASGEGRSLQYSGRPLSQILG